MQALIKRKLEEQKENFRRRQGDSEPPISTVAAASQPASVASMVSSGSPLAFTPTSVMRKNAAERKDSDPMTRGGNGVPEVKVTTQKEGGAGGPQPPPSPGRPITKGKEERPASLELGPGQAVPGGRRLSPQQMPPQQMFPPHLQGSLPHNNPLLYLQNNPMGPVSHSMLSKIDFILFHFCNVFAQVKLMPWLSTKWPLLTSWPRAWILAMLVLEECHPNTCNVLSVCHQIDHALTWLHLLSLRIKICCGLFLLFSLVSFSPSHRGSCVILMRAPILCSISLVRWQGTYVMT